MDKKDKKKMLIELFLCFFKIGSFTFGGGFAMIPLIERELVDKKKWVDKNEVIDVFAFAQSLPGAIAINTSTFIGYKILGRLGAIVATIGVVLPSVIIITLVAMFFLAVRGNPIFDAVFDGISPAIVALILVSGIRIAKESIRDKLGVVILLCTIILVAFFKVQAIFAIVGGALIGIGIYLFAPELTKRITKDGGDSNGVS